MRGDEEREREGGERGREREGEGERERGKIKKLLISDKHDYFVSMCH